MTCGIFRYIDRILSEYSFAAMILHILTFALGVSVFLVLLLQ